ncbi:hypothetical protein LXL04_038330 [Taraxacum kok-saghyz]
MVQLQQTGPFVERWKGKEASFMTSNKHGDKEKKDRGIHHDYKGFKLVEGDKNGLQRVALNSLQTLKNKQCSSYRLQTFGPPLLLQRVADVVRRLQMFWLRKNKQHLSRRIKKINLVIQIREGN